MMRAVRRAARAALTTVHVPCLTAACPSAAVSPGFVAPLADRLLQQLSVRTQSTSTDLKTVMQEKIPEQQALLKRLKSELGKEVLGQTTVDMCVGGMRGVPGMLWEPSLLDPEEGIRFRGYSIPECQKLLPPAVPGGEPMPEGMLWLLMTGDMPTAAQAQALSDELKSRSTMPAYVYEVAKDLEDSTHPMTQLCSLVLALQPASQFWQAYTKGINKAKYWEPTFEDTLNLIAKLPEIAAIIYRNTYEGGKLIEYNKDLDWAANLTYMMGFNDPDAFEMMRLYQTIHCDHEGGNVSAHATHLVGSALSDPYLSLTAGLAGLAGPLHGLANQEVLRWMQGVMQEVGPNPDKQQLKDFIWATLKSGKVVPGFGHAVLRKTDPRYECQREFARKHMLNYPLFKLCSDLYDVVPPILLETGKVKNPFPNVDAHSGVLLQYYGIKQDNFYTVLFGVSRSLGVLTQQVWSRALGLPIERPKSLTMKKIFQLFGKEV